MRRGVNVYSQNKFTLIRLYMYISYAGEHRKQQKGWRCRNNGKCFHSESFGSTGPVVATLALYACMIIIYGNYCNNGHQSGQSTLCPEINTAAYEAI